MTSTSFDTSIQPAPVGQHSFVLDGWDSLRDQSISPRFISELNEDTELREEFLTGAEALGLMRGRKSLQPQQLLLADVLNAGHKFTGVMMPRRSTKTTSLLAWAVGRCLSREDTYIAYSVRVCPSIG